MRLRYPLAVLSLVGSIVFAVPAHAVIQLSWGMPYPIEYGIETQFECGSPDTYRDLCISIMPNRDLPGFVELNLKIDMATGTNFPPVLMPLEPFWDYGASGCNPNGIELILEPPSGAESMPSIWNGPVPAGSWAYGQMTQTNHVVRLVLDIYSSSGMPQTELHTGQWYYVGRLRFAACRANTCPGCTQAVAIVGNDGTLYAGSPPYEIDYNHYGNCVTINHSDLCSVTAFTASSAGPPVQPSRAKLANRIATECDVVSVLPSSWGSLKLLYR